MCLLLQKKNKCVAYHLKQKEEYLFVEKKCFFFLRYYRKQR